jgi:uncharacterized membrane protein
MTWLRWAGPALLVLGVALLGAAVVTGSANLVLVVFVPVLTGGASLLFLGGVASVFLGVLLVPFAFGYELVDSTEAEAVGSPSPGASAGGVILLGPVPIFLGSWRQPSRRTYWFAVVAGAVLLVVAVGLAWWLH